MIFFQNLTLFCELLWSGIEFHCQMESTVRRMKRTAGVNLSSLIWNFAAVALLILVTRAAAAVDFTRSEDSLGNLDIYEVWSQ